MAFWGLSLSAAAAKAPPKAPMPRSAAKKGGSAPGKGAKRRKHVSFAPVKASNSSVNSGAYVVPGDEVADEDLELDFLDWASCERSRGLDVRLSVRTRILLACHACDHLEKSVLIESWERSGLVPFDPARVLGTLADEEDGGPDRRRSGRVKSKDAAKEICNLAKQYAAGEIDEQQLIIGVKKLADDAVCYHITESTGAAAAKGVKSGAIPKDGSFNKKKRKTSKTDQFRTNSFQGSDYDQVADALDEADAALNRSKPWECKVVASKSKKECGHRLKSNAGLTKHAVAKHHGIGKYKNHLTQELKTFVAGEAADAAAQAASVAPAAAGSSSPSPSPPRAAAAAAGTVAVDKRVKCWCGGFYTLATIDQHNNKKRHRDACGL